MSEAKPFASLSSGLLARKGAAKPAMRRPNTALNPEYDQGNGQDDLGWNDMGYEVDPDIFTEAVREKPINPLANAIEIPKPEVKEQQERIAAQLQLSNEVDEAKLSKMDSPAITPVEPVSQIIEKQVEESNRDVPLVQPHIKPMAKKPQISKQDANARAKVAFTLRIDSERHLKLRLACAINNISAQKFVMDALEKKLNEMEQIDHLSGQIIEK